VGQSVNPEMIVLARESRGLNQTELAQLIGVSQAKISRYENGMLDVSPEDLAAIAEKTRYTVEFFQQTDKVYGLGSAMLFNRRQLTAPMAQQRRAQANVNILRMQVERLLRGAEIEAEHRIEPIDIHAHNGDAAAVAQRVRAAWRMPAGPVPNVTAAIEAAGGIVMLCDFGTPTIDAAHLWLPGLPPMFFMNRDVPGDRHRFNLAHELGHAVMHQFPAGDIEKEANAFAREFLMPGRDIVHQLEGLTLDTAAALKPHWKTSIHAIVYHARELGCITEWQARRLFTRLGAMGYRKREPIAVPTEEPTIVPQLVVVHRRAFGYTDEELRRLLFDRDPEPEFFSMMVGVAKGLPPMRIAGDPIKLFREG
jgi:Zn-dependent peptidase ImmA (M78 family)/transcriptional regulator with XRE-family HTH domain